MNVYPEHATLEDIISSLPGIYGVHTNYPMKTLEPIKFFFYVSEESDEGLFLLTRCIDRRYWFYGNKWNIKLSSGDSFTERNKRPITYVLNSGDVVGKDAIEQMYDYINNINETLDSRAFELGFELNKEKFINNYILYERQKKIYKIRISSL